MCEKSKDERGNEAFVKTNILNL